MLFVHLIFKSKKDIVFFFFFFKEQLEVYRTGEAAGREQPRFDSTDLSNKG